MGAEAYEIKMFGIRLTVDQDQIRTNMAVSMITPVSDKRVVTISPGENLVGNQHRYNLRQATIQRFSMPSLFFAFVIAFEGCGSPNRPHSDQPPGRSIHRQ